jgi:hypothetical protein
VPSEECSEVLIPAWPKVRYSGNSATLSGNPGPVTFDKLNALAFSARVGAGEPPLSKSPGLNDFMQQIVGGLFCVLSGGEVFSQPHVQ